MNLIFTKIKEFCTIKDEYFRWKEILDELRERLGLPFKSPTFIGYFILVIMGVGAFGILDPWVKHFYFNTITYEEFSKSYFSALYTYSVAITATAVTDMVISQQEPKSLSMFFLLGGAIVVFCAWLSSGNTANFASLPLVFGYVLSLLLWWLSNAKNTNIQDPVPPPLNQMGGNDTNRDLPGSLEGFKVNS